MKKQYAFTLIELLVVLAVLSVLLMLGAPSFKDFQISSKLSSQTNSLVAALHATKNEAIKRNTPSYLVPQDGSNWNNGWLAFVDNDFDGEFSENSDLLILENEFPSDTLKISASGTAAGNSPYISFDGSGYPRSKSSAPGNLTLNISLLTSDSSEVIKHTRRIKLAVTGRIRSCKPASASDAQCSSSGN